MADRGTARPGRIRTVGPAAGGARRWGRDAHGAVSMVVMVEGPDPDLPGGPPPRTPHPLRRPAGRRVALAAAALLAAAFVADGAADRTRLAAIDALPGALHPLDGDLRPLWVLDEKDAGALERGILLDGVLVGPVGGASGWADYAAGSLTGFAGFDPDRGTRLWTLPVAPPAQGDDGRTAGWCQPVADLALCTAQAWGDESPDMWQQVWLVRPDDGHVVRAWAPGAVWATGAVGGALVEQTGRDAAGMPSQRPDQADHQVVTATDPVTGAVRWTWTSPSASQAGGQWWNGGWATDDHWIVSRGEHAWLIDAHGGVRQVDGLAEDSYTDLTRGGGVVETQWGEGSSGVPDAVWYLPPQGPRRELVGTPLWLSVDDGSAPGLMLLDGLRDGTRFVAAADVATGATRWTFDVDASQAVLVAGRLVLLGPSRLTALDVETGAALWSVTTGGALRALATDGEVALASHGNAVVEAFALSDGRRLWERDLGRAAAGAVASEGTAGSAGSSGSSASEGTAGSSGSSNPAAGAWVRLDSPLRHPVVMRPDGTAVVMG